MVSKEEEGVPLNDVSTNESDDVAIRLSSTYKHYGTHSKQTPVLVDLDMEVLKGQIYGLLGPSGCGKTTLLKCIVGNLKIDSGSIEVFGQSPGEPGSGVPGRRVGYMPQELALFGEFNITETLQYFGRIFGLSKAKFKERLEFLMSFLDLPSKTRMLRNMSGGQQRRASLAVALLHEPELLILDEPTVGVDPLLRTSIWRHMTAISQSMKTTIVITTHYIEEARQANRVGMMRFGKLLAEGSPKHLLEKFEKPCLESVFLELCVRDGDLEQSRIRETQNLKNQQKNKRRATAFVNNILKNKKSKDSSSEPTEIAIMSDTSSPQILISGNPLNSTKSISPSDQKKSSLSCPSFRPKECIRAQNLNACIIKTFNRMKKRLGFLIYQFVLPALQVSLFCLAIGQDPKNLEIAIVNKELPVCPTQSEDFSQLCPVEFGSLGLLQPNQHLSNFSCRFLSYLDSNIVTPKYYKDYESAFDSVSVGETWGVVSFDSNFSQNLYDRVFETMLSSDFRNVDRDILEKSNIRIKMDVTNQHIAFTLRLKFIEGFQRFITDMITSCGMPREIADIPLAFENPIYGNEELTFTDFMAPGIILTIVHSMALGYSAMIIIIERNEGLLDRTWIAGVTPGEFALAHFLVSLFINLVQVAVTLIFMILIFKVPVEGSILWIFLLTMLQGISGTTIGLIISAVCQTQQDATQIALGIFYPNLLLSGIIWPIESMPRFLRYISYCLPQTFACEAMRGILLRGWDLSYMPIWRGYLVTIAWIVVTYIIFKQIVNKRK